MLRKKEEYPWITKEIRNMIRRRNRAFRKWKKHKTDEYRDKMKEESRKVQQKLRQAHWDYLNDTFLHQDSDEDTCQRRKRFWKYIKNQRNSNTGVAPLKDQGKLVTEPESKAELLNKQFDSAVSTGKEYIHEEFQKKCQMPPNDYKEMPPINITCPGVEIRKDPLQASSIQSNRSRRHTSKDPQDTFKRDSTDPDYYLSAFAQDRLRPISVEESKRFSHLQKGGTLQAIKLSAGVINIYPLQGHGTYHYESVDEPPRRQQHPSSKPARVQEKEIL